MCGLGRTSALIANTFERRGYICHKRLFFSDFVDMTPKNNKTMNKNAKIRFGRDLSLKSASP